MEVMQNVSFDIVTVHHNRYNRNLMNSRLLPSLDNHEQFGWYFYDVDNSSDNRGFAKGCNYGAGQGTSQIIAFINPDAIVRGSFMDNVRFVLNNIGDEVVITGSNFNKNPVEIKGWGLRDWVCGAAMFVRRSWFESVGGFDERFVWSHEETDLIHQADAMNYRCVSFSPEKLPIDHVSPEIDSPEDTEYKRIHFAEAAARYREKWG